MQSIGRLWAGRVWGTNTGNLFLELEGTTGSLTGTLRFLDAAFGLTIYRVEGKFEGSSLDLTGKPEMIPSGIEQGELVAHASLTPEGEFRGRWSSSLGTAGTFALFPHDLPEGRQAEQSSVPEQLHSVSIELGALRLYASDLRELARFINRDYTSGRMIVTYITRGNEITRFFEDFEKDAENLGEMRYLKMLIQEPEAHGLIRMVMVELNSLGNNQVRVQGIHEPWVIGKAEAIARHLRQYEKSLVTTYKKFGLNLNQFLFLAMVVTMPSIQSIFDRSVFAGVMVVLLVMLVWVHSRLIPSAALYMSPRAPGVLARAWPSVLSWLITVLASLTAMGVFYLLTRQTPP